MTDSLCSKRKLADSFIPCEIFSTRYRVTLKVYTGYHAKSKTEPVCPPVFVDNPLGKARGLSLRTDGQPCSLSFTCKEPLLPSSLLIFRFWFRDPLKPEIFSTVNGVLLYTIFHYDPPPPPHTHTIVLVRLIYFYKDVNSRHPYGQPTIGYGWSLYRVLSPDQKVLLKYALFKFFVFA